MFGYEEKTVETQSLDRDYQSELAEIMGNAKRGNALCYHMYKWFLEVPHELRPKLLESFFVLYYWEHSNGSQEFSEMPSKELFELYEKNKLLYKREIDKLVYENLSEEEFYKRLNSYIFSEETEAQNDRFWKFYSCIINYFLPYYRVELEKAKEIDVETYKECRKKLGPEIFFRIDTAAIEKMYDTSIKKAQCIIELIDKGETFIERAVLMEEAVRLIFYVAQHYNDVIAYQNGERGLRLESEGEIYEYFSHESGEQRIEVKEKTDYMSGKEFAKRSVKLGAGKCLKTDRIMHYVESGKYDTYLQISQILLEFIEREPDFFDRVTLFAYAIEYCELLKE